jgi:hypothetical protein
MTFRKLFAWGTLAAAYLFVMAVTALAQGTILNVSYDVSRELYKDINPAFVAHWKAQTGETIAVNQSHGGSSKQALSVASGLEADVVSTASGRAMRRCWPGTPVVFPPSIRLGSRTRSAVRTRCKQCILPTARYTTRSW